jgi:hypothetical protein
VTLTPRVVVVHRRTEREELVRQQGTWGQAEFVQRRRGLSLAPVQARHSLVGRALQTVSAAIPSGWRRGAVERSDLDRFLFEPEDVVIVVGQDGLVANTAKYLSGQPVIGVNPDPDDGMGVLVRHAPQRCAALLAEVAQRRARTEERTMVAASGGDGLEMTALNEVYLGSPGHQSARYELRLPDGRVEAQSSSGMLVGTGTGATGWLLSAARERRSPLTLPAPTEPALGWFVREAWPSPNTGAELTEGLIGPGAELSVLVRSESLVLFGDGIESDRITLGWGRTVTIRAAGRKLVLVV